MNIIIRSVDEENVDAILELDVCENQRNFIETTKQCLDEAKELALWRPVGIYDEEILIGFAMYGLWENEENRVWLDRFLIDCRYQNKGYAKPVLKKLIEHIQNIYQQKTLYLSIYEDNSKAIALYQSLGFVFNGEKDINQEWVMVLNIS